MLTAPSAWEAAGEYFDFAGKRVFFRRGGDWADTSASALVLLHGFPTASWDWQRVWVDLTLWQRVVAPDFLGFGFSDKPPGHRYTIAEQADLVESLVRALGLREAHLLAHDYGDTVAQELMARALERAQRGVDGVRWVSVCLLNGGLFPEAHRPRPVQRLLAGRFGPWVARAMNRRRFGRSFAAVFGPETPPGEAELDGFWALLQHGGGHAAIPRLISYMEERRTYRGRWVGALQRWPGALLVIDGLDDPVSGRHMVERLRALVPTARVVELAGIGHYPQWEAPQAVLAAYRAFRGIGGRGLADQLGQTAGH